MEVELKLLISPTHIKKLQRLPQFKNLALQAPTVQDMTSIYFDTPDLLLRRSEAGLRVRQTGGRWVQTLKAGGSVHGGLHSRNEWESPVGGPQPDIGALLDVVERGTRWRHLLQTSSLTQELRPIFATHFRRTAWLLRLATGEELEFALDEGTIECNGRSEPISEVEMELISGSPANLLRFALELIERMPMRVGNANKAERGYAMYAPQPLASVTALSVALSRKLSIEAGFQQVFLSCMAQIQGNEDGVAAGDSECVHQMRVGLRRLRCALKLFCDVISFPDGLQKELSWLSSALGAARDWDVLAMHTLAAITAAMGKHVDIAPALKAANVEAKKKRESAAQAVMSARYAKLILALFAWLYGAHHMRVAQESKSKADHGLEKFSDKTLDRLHKTLHKRGRRLDHDPKSRHRLRIAAKNLRYASEFFQSLYPARQVRRHTDKLRKLQDELGLLNDAAVANALLLELQRSGPTDLAAAAGYARGYLHADVTQDRSKLCELCRSLAKITALAPK